MKVLVGAFNQEKALVGAFSVIVKLCVIFGNLRLQLYCLATALCTDNQDQYHRSKRRHVTSIHQESRVIL